jgi:hypothetical protein
MFHRTECLIYLWVTIQIGSGLMASDTTVRFKFYVNSHNNNNNNDNLIQICYWYADTDTAQKNNSNQIIKKCHHCNGS